MGNKERRWEIKQTSEKSLPNLDTEEILTVLLKNRGITSKEEQKEFFNPQDPEKISLKDLGIETALVSRAVKRVQKAVEGDETIVIFGDYDVDGISATGILFETLFLFSKKVHPYLPDRFSEGYGLKPESVEKLKKEFPDLGLIITVDNGITAFGGVKKAGELGVDVIITDHHTRKAKSPDSYVSLYTKKVGGAEIAWIFARELRKKLGKKGEIPKLGDGLELAALGTIADILPLLGPNRSIAKEGISRLRKTVRPGLQAIFSQARIEKEEIGTYHIGYIICPRLNAAGRLENGLISLQLLCTTSPERARALAEKLGIINSRRQRIQEEVSVSARALVAKKGQEKVIILADGTYHEGVIGLAAGKLVEEFHLPAIVISQKEGSSKASARSIPGFNLIEALSMVEEEFGLALGGHEMAAGFSIETAKIEVFSRRFREVTRELLTPEILTKKLKIDLVIPFSAVTRDLFDRIQDFEPTGAGNPAPTFATYKVRVLEARTVGREGNHLKMKLEEGGITFGAIAFGFGNLGKSLAPGTGVDIAYNLSNSVWNGSETLELKIRDMKLS